MARLFNRAERLDRTRRQTPARSKPAGTTKWFKRRQVLESLEQRQLLAGDVNDAFGDELQVYRLAVATTAEFTNMVGGVAATSAAIDTLVADLNAIYEPEMAIRFVLAGNNDSLLFTDASTDGFTNGDLGSMIVESTGVIDATLGSSSSQNAVRADLPIPTGGPTSLYDIGHVLGTYPTLGSGGSSGLAYLGQVGDFDDYYSNDTALKAGGGTITGSASSVNSLGWTAVVAHEIGHQFGAEHTFNSDLAGNCANSREGDTAYEPASGSTIMSYAGICGADDLQPQEDMVFHSASVEQMLREITANVPQQDASPFTTITLSNTIPAVDATPGDANTPTTTTSGSVTTAGSTAAYTIPAGTPFELTGVGTDADAGDSLTYSWEQLDLGPAQNLPLSGAIDGPIFRAYAPTSDPTRVFPNLDDLLAGNSTAGAGEVLPTIDRDLNFRVTVRDGNGGINSDDVKLNVVATGTTPFAVDPVASTVAGGSALNVAWNVGGTSGASIGATDVEVMLSTDGGQTFTQSLGTYPNNGAATVNLPNVDAAAARIKIKPTNNVFFAINDADFVIQSSSGAAGVTLLASDVKVAEDGTVGIASQDTYTLALNTAPASPVDITVTAPGEVEVSFDGLTFAAAATATVTDTAARTVYVRAIDDTDREGSGGVTLTHSIGSADPDYAAAVIPDVDVAVYDDEDQPLIAVEFGTDGVAPENWNFNSASFNGSLSNLIREDGSVTDVGFVQTYSGGTAGIGQSGSVQQPPIHTPELSDLDGYRISSVTGEFTLTGLDPNADYNVYVITTEWFSVDVNQTVTVTGDSSTSFTQNNVGNNQRVLVNGTLVTSSDRLTDQGVLVRPDAAGEIRVSIAKDSTVAYAWISALAVQPVTVTPEVPLSITNLDVGNQYLENGGVINLRVTRTDGGDPVNDLTVDVTTDLPGEIGGPTSVTIPAGQTFADVALPIIDDAVDEPDEAFTVSIGTAGTSTVETFGGTILDDDVPATLTLTRQYSSVAEGINVQDFTVTRTGDTSSDLVVTLDQTADLDYFILVNGAAVGLTDSVTIPAGQSSVAFRAGIIADNLVEGDESIAVTATAGSLTSTSSVFTIVDGDSIGPIDLVIDDTRLTEGETSSATVSIATPSVSDVTVALVSSDTSEISVPASVTIPAGQTSVSFTVTAEDDPYGYGDAYWEIDVTASAAGFVDTEIVEVFSDDSLGGTIEYLVNGVDIAPINSRIFIPEGETVTVVWTLASPLEFDGVIRRSNEFVSGSFGTRADSGLDYTRVGSDSFPVQTGDTQFSFTTETTDDILDEVDFEYFQDRYTYRNGDGDSLAVLRTLYFGISDDDRYDVSLTVDTSTINENGGVAVATLSSSGPLGQSVSYSFADDPAGRVRFPNSSPSLSSTRQSTTFDLVAIDNAVFEGDLSVVIDAEALNGFYGTLNDVQTTLAIVDDESIAPLALAIADTTISENGGATTGTVTINDPAAFDITIDLSSNDTTGATVPAAVTIPAGQTSATFPITAVDDAFGRGDGDQVTRITADYQGVTASRNVVVTNDDSAGLTITYEVNGTPATPGADGALSVTEGDIVATILTFDAPVNEVANLTRSQLGGPGDLVTPSDIAELGANQRAVSPFTLAYRYETEIVDDAIDENDGEVSRRQFLYSRPVGSAFVEGTAVFVITDNDTAVPSLSFDSAAIDEDGGTATATLSISTPHEDDLTFTLTSDDTDEATVPTDVTIPAGQTSVTFDVTAVDDNIDQAADATVLVTASNALVGDADGTITLADDDVATLDSLQLSVGSISENGGTSVGTVRIDTEADFDIVVTLTNEDPTEISVPSSVTIPAGQTSATFTVSAIDNPFGFGDLTDGKRITAEYSGVTATDAVSVISEDPITRSVTFLVGGVVVTPDASNQINVGEGDTLTARFEFDAPVATDTRVSREGLASSPDPAFVGTDFQSTSPSFVDLAQGDTTAEFTYDIIDDDIDEADPERFTVRFVHQQLPGGPRFNTTNYTVLIGDDDTAVPSISLADASIAESGSTVATVSLSTPRSRSTVFTLSSDDVTEATTNVTTLTIPAGQTSATAIVYGESDNLDDADQTATITAASDLGDVSSSLTVTNDDTATLTATLATPNDSGRISERVTNPNTADLTLTLDVVRDVDTVITLASSDTTEATVASTVTIPAGQTSVTTPVTSVEDNLIDGTKTVTISITSDRGDATETVDVVDNDSGTLTISFDPSTISENGGTTTGTITLSTPFESDQTWVLSGGDGTELDFPASVVMPGQSGVLAPGTTGSVTFTATGIDDAVEDGNQIVTVAVAFPNSTPSWFADVTVTDDETATLSASLSAGSIAENGSATLDLTLSTARVVDTVVTLTTSDAGEATLPTSVTIPAGDTTISVPVGGVADNLVDGTQTVSIGVTSDAGDETLSIDVTDADTFDLTASVDAVSIAEGNTATLTVDLGTPTTSDVTLSLASSDTTEATVPATITIPAGSTSGSVAVAGIVDTLVDGPQTVTLTASDATVGSASTTLGVVDIDSASLSIAIDNATIAEDGTATATVSLSTPTTADVVVTLGTTDATELSVPSTVTIPAGQTSAAFTVAGVTDNLVDGDVAARITTLSTFGGPFIDVTVTDVDVATYTLSFDAASVVEGGQVTGTLSTDTPLAADQTFDLFADGVNELSVPATVTLTAGATSVDFTATGVDEPFEDGNQLVTVDASQSGVTVADTTITVVDNDVATLFLSSGVPSFDEGTAGALTINLSTPRSVDTVVTIVNGDPGELTPTSTTVTIGAFNSAASIGLIGIQDGVVDGDQIVTLTATSAIGDDSFDVTVRDSDASTLTLTTDDATVDENGDTTTATLTLSKPYEVDVTVDLTVDQADQLGFLPGTSLTIPAGDTTRNFTIIGDNNVIDDGDRIVTVTATPSVPAGSNVVAPAAADLDITVIDEDVSVLELSGLTTVAEGDEGQLVANLTFARTVDTLVTLSVDDGTEASLSLGTYTIPAGQRFLPAVIVDGLPDNLVDGDQTVVITAASDVGNPTRTITVTDADTSTAAITFDASSLSENNGTATGTITLTTPLTQDVTYALSVDDGTEASIAPALVTIAAGDTAATFTLTGIDDAVADGDQTVTVTAAPDAATLAGLTTINRTITVTDDEGTPTLTLAASDTSIDESNSATLTVGLSVARTVDTVVNLSGDGSNLLGFPASVTISAGTLSVDVTATAADDNVDQAIDARGTTITAAATDLSDATLSVDVVDDDVAVLTIETDDAAIAEDGSTQLFVRLSVPRDVVTPVSLTSNDTGEATSGASVLNIPAFGNFANGPVDGVTDGIVDGTQTVTLTAGNADVGIATTTIDVTDIDAATVALSIDAASIAENGGVATGTITLSAASATDTVVTLTSDDPSRATVPADVTVPAGSTTATFDVTAVDDNVENDDALITVTATTPGSTDDASVTVVNDDVAALSISLADGTIVESGSTTLDLSLSVARSVDTVITLTSGDTTEATLPASVTIPAGQTTASATVSGVQDNFVDTDKTFDITATSDAGDDAAAITVDNEDAAAFTLTFDQTSITENDGTATGTLSVTPLVEVDLAFELVVDDASELSVPTSITLPAGQSSVSFTATGIDDSDVDGDQTVGVQAVFDGALPVASASIVVADDDTATANDAPEIDTLVAPDAADKGREDQSLTLSGSFTDADLNDSHTVTIDWGDGTTTVLSGSDVDQVGDTFQAAHTYDDGGVYTATVTVDDGTDSDTESVDVVVSGSRLRDDGTLEIVGTNQRDVIVMWRSNGRVRMRSWINGIGYRYKTFAQDSVTSIDVDLCAGDDFFRGSNSILAPITIDGGAGNDRMYAGGGDDTIVDLSGNNVAVGYNGDDVVKLGGGNDWTRGNSGNDVINTGGGNDRAYGDNGDDLIRGGDGSDHLYGGSGNDILIGGNGVDRIWGGWGRDVISGGNGTDYLYGQRGDDIVNGGTTSFDDNDEALRAIAAEWNSGRSYEDRVANLRSGVGANNDIALIAGDTVGGDGAYDVVRGNAERDWLFATSNDSIDKAGNERLN